MKKLLITGFEPFGGETINPSWEAVKLLPEVIGEYQLIKLELPTVFGLAAKTVLNAAEEQNPDVILSVGQAGGRTAITPEYAALNIRHANIPDNAGNMLQEQPVIAGGENALFSTVPVMNMVAAIREAGLSGAVSFHAGTFVCNDLLYTLLHRYLGTNMRAGFIHVPFLPEQAKEHQSSMSLQDICKGLCAAIEAI